MSEIYRRYLPLFFLVLVLLGICGCNSNSELLQYSLNSAGNNREELEKVLDHYSKANEDSLKLKAAMFLIENMPFHFSYYGSKVDSMNRIFELLARLKYLQSELSEENKVAAVDSISKRLRRYHLNDSMQADNSMLNAEYLINNIEEAFKAWEMAIWHDKVDFKMFCEYILPYRIRKERPEYWRNYLRTKFIQEQNNIENSDNLDSLFNYYIKYYYNIIGSKVETAYGYDMNFSQLDISLAGECLDRCAYQIYFNRAIAIPATYDYIPNWGNRPFALHAMVGNATNVQQVDELISNKNKPILKNNRISDASPKPTAHVFTKDEIIEGLYVQYIKTIPKVFRSTWSAQIELIEIYKNVPISQIYTNLVNVNSIDVSNQYLETADVELNLPDEYTEYKIAYLSVFQPSGWCPVAFTRSDAENKLRFTDMGKHVLYLPMVYNKQRLQPIGNPFYVDDDNSVHAIKSDQPQSMHLIRKYPFFSYTSNHSYWFWGIYFEGANKSDFSDAELLHKVDYYSFYMTEAKISNPKKFRYIRCCPCPNSKLTIAEIDYYGIQGKDTVKLKGKPYARFSDDEMVTKAFDKDILSFYRNYSKDEPLCFDLGEKNSSQITTIKFCPQNDANCIIPNNRYRLYYWSNKWELIDDKIATDYFIDFKNVPSNGLYWLECPDGGKEERLFTYENCTQVWW